MLRRACTFSCYVLLFSFCLVGPLRAQAPARAVRVSTGGSIGTVRSLTVATGGPWRLIDLGDRHLVREGTGTVEWRFEPAPGGRVSARGAGAANLTAAGFRLEAAAPESQFAVKGGPRPRVYPGAVEILPPASGVRRGASSGVRLINEAPLEPYLTGVVTAEGAASFHPEALKALAVAARSYAERNRLRHHPDAELCDTVHCQVYPGVGQVPEKVARAVADTTGVVALSEGQVIDAVFSADCGGRTRNSEEIWPRQIPYLRSVVDRPPAGGPDYCSVYRNHAARVVLSPDQVARLWGLGSATAGPIELHGVERDGSGRVTGIRIAVGPAPEGDELLPCERQESGERATADPTPARVMTVDQIRKKLGAKLRSQVVSVLPTAEGGLELDSRGLGHGVGLCQWGAQGMALPPHNRTCEEILRHYYTGINVGAAPVRTARLSLQLGGPNGQPLAGVAVRLLPGGPAGTTDGQGCWEAGPVAEGTYMVEARRGGETTTFYAVRVAAAKSPELRLALQWRNRNPRVAQVSVGSPGG